MKRESLISISRKLRQITYARKCHYLKVCRDCEVYGSERWYWMQNNLEATRTLQIRQENKRERVSA